MTPAKITIHRPPPSSAFREYIAGVHEGRFPERSHLVEMEAPLLDEVVRSISGAPSDNQK